MSDTRKAFEKWWDGYDLTKNNTVSSTRALELLYDAWLARGEHDAKVCDELVDEAFNRGDQTAQQYFEYCVKAIREGDV